jgi:hypothetical protein
MKKEVISKKAPQSDNAELIKELRSENERLRAEIQRYRYEKDISSSLQARHREKFWQLSMRQGCAKRELFERKNFASYLFGTFKNRTFFLYYQKFVNFVRKYALVTTTLKILLFLWTVLQSSALFVLFTGSVAISAPFTIIFSYITILLTFFGRKNLNRRIKHVLDDKKVTVLFPPKGRPFEPDSYFRHLVNTLSSSPDMAVVIVSPYYFSSKGMSNLNPKRYYIAARTESEGERNIIMIRKHYFLTFKKHVLSDIGKNLTYIF